MGCHIYVYAENEVEITVPSVRVPPVFYDCSFGRQNCALWFLDALRDGNFPCEALEKATGRKDVTGLLSATTSQQKCCSVCVCRPFGFGHADLSRIESIIRQLGEKFLCLKTA